jgi:hypothetical protein
MGSCWDSLRSGRSLENYATYNQDREPNSRSKHNLSLILCTTNSLLQTASYSILHQTSNSNSQYKSIGEQYIMIST